MQVGNFLVLCGPLNWGAIYHKVASKVACPFNNRSFAQISVSHSGRNSMLLLSFLKIKQSKTV